MIHLWRYINNLYGDIKQYRKSLYYRLDFYKIKTPADSLCTAFL